MGLKIVETPLQGVFVIEPVPMEDSRGLFARTYCSETFGAHGLHTEWVQCNTSYNARRGTLRGLHFQRAPSEEPKLVRVTRGRIYDVAVDLRRDSSSFCRYFAIELTATERKALYVPKGFAHGFQSLEDETEVFYQMGEAYRADLADGVRWDDPAFGIKWPVDVPILSSRDACYPDFAR